MPVGARRLFRRLSRLRGPHRRSTRLAASRAAYVATLALTGRTVLASEAAALFDRDDFTLGSHRLRFYLAHARLARQSTPKPSFDPTLSMPAPVVPALLARLADRDHPSAALARMNALARLSLEAPDAATQSRLFDRIEAEGQALVPRIAAPNLSARSEKHADFTLTDARAALRDLKAAMTQPWYVVSGTFLGAVREGDFLPHDYDIDIGIDAADFDEAVFFAAIARHPDLVFVNESRHLHLAPGDRGRLRGVSRPALYRVLHRSGIGIDVFIHHAKGDLVWHGSALHRWDNTPFALAETALGEIEVRGPADADRYLTENYGADWRVPKTSFDCSTGTPNVSFPANPAAAINWLRQATLGTDPRDTEVARLILWQEGYLSGPPESPLFTLPWRTKTPPEELAMPGEAG